MRSSRQVHAKGYHRVGRYHNVSTHHDCPNSVAPLNSDVHEGPTELDACLGSER